MRAERIAPEPKRLRASEAAIRAALQALKASGLPVDKVCVIGGHVEIHCGHVDGGASPEKDEGLEKW
ncbi:hypothetical protein [Mesorhizobium sp. B2-1-3A]|uniref:hypothetical protein n=1 Tax=Mesorhizobium sp. B2-1-3A TaxID=2589971 RepID=UPI001128CDF5|nr:hypothetical protein [Mesorhizobium sp. B2-1-3A]TPM89824.1 hypothetical protein FJ977_35165 [Mesorhizobium sp. B2-1-3A]